MAASKSITLAADLDPVLFPEWDEGLTAGVWSSSSLTKSRGSSEGLLCSTGSGSKPIIAFNSAGVTDFRARPRPGSESRLGVLANLGLAVVLGGEVLRAPGVDFRLFAWGAVAGALFAREGWEEVDWDNG
jgi:hypothetical protein